MCKRFIQSRFSCVSILAHTPGYFSFRYSAPPRFKTIHFKHLKQFVIIVSFTHNKQTKVNGFNGKFHVVQRSIQNDSDAKS